MQAEPPKVQWGLRVGEALPGAASASGGSFAEKIQSPAVVTGAGPSQQPSPVTAKETSQLQGKVFSYDSKAWWQSPWGWLHLLPAPNLPASTSRLGDTPKHLTSHTRQGDSCPYPRTNDHLTVPSGVVSEPSRSMMSPWGQEMPMDPLSWLVPASTSSPLCSNCHQSENTNKQNMHKGMGSQMILPGSQKWQLAFSFLCDHLAVQEFSPAPVLLPSCGLCWCHYHSKQPGTHGNQSSFHVSW